MACGEDAVLPGEDAGDGGQGPVDTGIRPDAGRPDVGTPPDLGPGPDTGVNPIPPDMTTVSGRVLRLDSYFNGTELTLFNTDITALGTVGVTPVKSDAQGGYRIVVPREGTIAFEARKGAHYTTYEEVTVGSTPVENKNLYLATEPYVDTIASVYNVDIDAPFACHAPNPTTEQCRYAIILGQILDDGTEQNGRPAPQSGVSAANFTVVGEGNETWYKKGPYFLNANGDAVASTMTSQRERDPVSNYYRGGLFALFVEVPVNGRADRSFEIRISAVRAANTVYYGPTYVKGFRQGLSWTKVVETGRDNPPPPPPPPNEPVDFDTQVYPLFLPVIQGGLGCQGCHTNEGGALPAGGMNLYGGPDVAFASLDPARYAQRVNVQNPTQSYVLTRPLYEANGVQDHPIYAFANELDPNYQRVYAWVVQGALRTVGVPPVVSFYNDVRPLLYQPYANGGIGCYDCHVNGVDANTAPGGAYYGGNGNDLYDVLTQQIPTDNGNTGEPYRINKLGNVGASLLLTNPLLGSPEPHPAKLLQGVQDARYQIIYTWIANGYINDTP
jgi:mono/diheme cytochrome c family protein